jgi:hypothetical protein
METAGNRTLLTLGLAVEDQPKQVYRDNDRIT